MEIFTNKQLIRYQVESTKIVPLIGAISLLVFPLHHKLMKKAKQIYMTMSNGQT
jgi:hypothetical protein